MKQNNSSKMRTQQWYRILAILRMELYQHHVDEGKDTRGFAARKTAVLTAATTALEIMGL